MMVAQFWIHGQTQPAAQESEFIQSEVKRGFTLVELLISVAVITMLAGMAAQTFRAVMTAREIAMRRLEVNETARASLDYISSEMRSAYLTPDSVKPVTANRLGLQDNGPRFRFLSISRDIEVKDNSGTPGAGKDDDGDGLIDEEVLDGVDGDYKGGAARSLQGVSPDPDPLGCEKGDEACVDEDIGLYPSDILHFVSAVESSGNIILQEISYGLDPTGTKLIRRAQVLDLSSGTTTQLMDFGQFVDDSSNKALVPNPVAVGQIMPQSWVKQAESMWNDGAVDGSIGKVSQTSSKNPASTFQVLAYDIRGLRFQFWYYDYNRGGWRVSQEWDSTRETALMSPTEKIFNKTAANNSIEGNTTQGVANIIVNEPEDMYPRVVGTLNQFLIADPKQIRSSAANPLNSPFYDLFLRIADRTDGLPNMVEITIYIQDQERKSNPKQYKTRVFIPNNYRSIGNL